MNHKTIAELESKIHALESAGSRQKQELLALVAKLKTEAGTRGPQDLQPLKHSVDELRSSVEGFEQSHPKLVVIVNNLSNTLANLGI